MTELRTRQIRERWIIAGTLELVTPASLSNGDDDPVIDLPLLTDPLEGRVLLTGASLAGALRNYLRSFGDANGANPAVTLFGGRREDPDGAQSPLIVEDAIGGPPRVELRDGVSINPETRTALDKAKYDRELLAAGTTFPIAFELLVSAEDAAAQKAALAQALSGLEAGDIRLGGRKRRGLGQCRVTAWRAWRYDLTTAAGLRGWLSHGRQEDAWTAGQTAPWTGDAIAEWPVLQNAAGLRDRRRRFTIEGDFEIDGSLLIRAGFEAEAAPDTAHLRSHRAGNAEPVPVISGTSLGGVIRAQALRIARTLSDKQAPADALINDLFGYMSPPDEAQEVRKASRVTVSESEVDGAHDLVQSRVRIDRFTGGAYESALFTEQPIFGGETTLRWEIKEPNEAEIGLLLLVLKDLWTGHVALGGEASVGRGRLRGRDATLTFQTPEETLTWRLSRSQDGGLAIDGDSPETMNAYVTALVTKLGGNQT